MNEYREWLEKQIDEMDTLAKNNAKAKLYGAANSYVTKMNAYKECLIMFEHFDKRDNENKKLNFNDIEVGKKYIGVLKDGTSNIFEVFSKGNDDKGSYIWYYSMVNVDKVYKTYEQDFVAADYFREVE